MRPKVGNTGCVTCLKLMPVRCICAVRLGRFKPESPDEEMTCDEALRNGASLVLDVTEVIGHPDAIKFRQQYNGPLGYDENGNRNNQKDVMLCLK